MSSARKVAFYAPDGTEVVYETAGKWDTAGIVQHADGKWSLAAHGFSAPSVRQRTITRYHRYGGLRAFEVTRIWETTAPVVREYFGSHRVWIHEVFTPGKGWTPGKHMAASRAAIRRLIREGATAIAFTDSDRTVDFQAAELQASLRQKGH
jgi:hypothetical protein